MGFKITHPLLPSRLLVWPLWHTSAWRLHVPPDRISGTSDTTKWPQCLHFRALLVFLIFRSVVFLVSRWRFFLHLFSCFKVAVFHQWIAIGIFLTTSVCLYPELLFIFMLLSVYWFLSVYESHYTCGHQCYLSWGLFCLSSCWIDFTIFKQTDSPTWLM